MKNLSGKFTVLTIRIYKLIVQTFFLHIINCILFILFLIQISFAKEKFVDINNIKSPQNGYIQIITTTDGSTNIGRIVELRENEILFETELGKLIIPITKISEIKEVPDSSIKNGKYWFPNPNATRLFFSPTGCMLKEGEGYFADYYVFFPAITYGLTDNITIGGGFSLFPGNDIMKQLFYFTPKIGLSKGEKFHIAAGALLIRVPDFSENGNSETILGIIYNVGTYGTKDNSITVGFGYGMMNDEFSDRPIFIIGGEKRFLSRMAFVTENWFVPGAEDPLISYGLRFFGETISVDLAFINILSGEAIFPGIPYIDFVYKF